MDLSKKILKNIFGRKNSMNIAQGSKSWILTAVTGTIFFIFLTIIINRVVLQIIFLFIAAVLFMLTGFFVIFFRDPKRKIGDGFVAVADGKIRDIKQLKDEDIKDCTLISTFMNIHNVHVNRMPIDGIVKKIKHISGMHLPAFKKESDKNERVIIILETRIGLVKIVQIAGAVARRIVPYIKTGDKLKKGEKIGIIRLGSRVDVYLKTEKIEDLKIKINDKIIAGETTLVKIDD